MSQPSGISTEEWEALKTSRPMILKGEQTAEVTLLGSKSPIPPELIEMMKVFVIQLQFSSDPSVALELLRHSVHLAQKSLEEPYDRVHYQTER